MVNFRMTFIVLHRVDRVFNIEGTAPCRPRHYDSWRHFWIHKSNTGWPDECRIAGCRNTATDGAHVNVQGRQPYYILPTCHNCNVSRRNEWLPVNANSVAVQVSERDTEEDGDGNCY